MDERHLCERLQLLAQLIGSIHEDLLQADHCGRACLDGHVFRDFDLANHLHRTVSRFRDRGGQTCENRPGCILGVDRVGLSSETPVTSIGSHDLERADAATPDRASEASTIGPSALDAEGEFPAEGFTPVD